MEQVYSSNGVPAVGAASAEGPLVVLGGRPMEQGEYRSLSRAMGGNRLRPWLPQTIFAAAVLAALLLVMAFDPDNLAFRRVILLLMGLSLTVTAAGIALIGYGCRRLSGANYRFLRSLQTDSAVELYADRVAEISRMANQTIPFSSLRWFIETPESFLFVDRTGGIIGLRAADLTPFDAQRVREIARACLPAAKRRWKGALIPRRERPLPIPVYDWDDRPIVVAEVDRGGRPAGRLHPLWVAPLLAGLSIGMGTAIALYFWFTTSYLLDVFLFAGIVFAVLAALGAMVSAVTSRRRWAALRDANGGRPLQAGFTKRDCLLATRFSTQRIPYERLRIDRGSKRFRLWMISGGEKRRLASIRWDAVSDRAALTALLPKNDGR